MCQKAATKQSNPLPFHFSQGHLYRFSDLPGENSPLQESLISVICCVSVTCCSALCPRTQLAPFLGLAERSLIFF